MYRRPPDSESFSSPRKEYRRGDWDKQREAFLDQETEWYDSLGQKKRGKRRDSPRYQMSYF